MQIDPVQQWPPIIYCGTSALLAVYSYISGLDAHRTRKDTVAWTFPIYRKIVAKPLSKDMPLNLITIGDHMRKRRIDLKMFQRQVSSIIGVSEETIVYWETHGTQPQIHFYPAIIKFLGYYPFDYTEDSFASNLKSTEFLRVLAIKNLAINSA